MRIHTPHKIIEQAESLLASDPKTWAMSPAEYLLLLMALRETAPGVASQLHLKLIEKPASQSPPVRLQLLAGLGLQLLAPQQEIQAQWSEHLRQALDLQEALRLQIDPHYSGLVQTELLSPAATEDILDTQCYWIRNIEALLELAPTAEETDELVLQLEILVHEANEQLWDSELGNYRTSHSTAHTPQQYLPLWARIPSLDQAEEMLANLQQHASPWKPSAKNQGWPGAISFLVFEGLKHYEMNTAANELRSYLLQQLRQQKDNWQGACLSICFASSSPA